MDDNIVWENIVKHLGAGVGVVCVCVCWDRGWSGEWGDDYWGCYVIRARLLRCPRLRCSLIRLQIEKKHSRNKVLPNYNEGTKEKIRFKSTTFDIEVLVDVLLVVVVEQCRQWGQVPEMMNSWIIWWVRLSQRLIQRKMTNMNTKPINFTGN